MSDLKSTDKEATRALEEYRAAQTELEDVADKPANDPKRRNAERRKKRALQRLQNVDDEYTVAAEKIDQEIIAQRTAILDQHRKKLEDLQRKAEDENTKGKKGKEIEREVERHEPPKQAGSSKTDLARLHDWSGTRHHHFKTKISEDDNHWWQYLFALDRKKQKQPGFAEGAGGFEAYKAHVAKWWQWNQEKEKKEKEKEKGNGKEGAKDTRDD